MHGHGRSLFSAAYTCDVRMCPLSQVAANPNFVAAQASVTAALETVSSHLGQAALYQAAVQHAEAEALWKAGVPAPLSCISLHVVGHK